MVLHQNYDQHQLLKISQLPETGQKARFNRMQRRLSMSFDFVKNNPLYADNRNSKGLYIPVFITLTYPSNDYWNPKDISSYCQKLRKYADRNFDMKEKLKILWVAETTKSGTIHYHLITWIPRNKRLPKPSMPMIVYYKNGNSREYPPMWKYRAKIEGVRKGVYGYMLKYMSKGCIVGGIGLYKDVQRGYNVEVVDSYYSDNFQPFDQYLVTDKIVRVYPRIFGYSGFSKDERERITYYMLPKYVREAFWHCRIGDNIRRVKGGFKMFKQSLIDRCGGYFVWHGLFGMPFIPCNYTPFTIEDFSGGHYVGYEFGKEWEFIIEHEIPDNIFIPF